MPKRVRIIGRSTRRIPSGTVSISALYGLDIIEKCLNCPHRAERIFSDLSAQQSEELSAITLGCSYPKGAQLFAEHHPARGVFIICSGRVKLFLSSQEGKTLNLRVARPGEILGLTASVTGKPYHAVAEVLEPSEIKFIPRTHFLKFLAEHGELALRVAQQLGESHHQTLSEMQKGGYARTASAKFARLLLEWSADQAGGKDEIHIKLSLTHEDIAQIIGVRRETMTRVFADFKKKHLLEVSGETVVIRNRAALEHVSTS